MVSYGHANSRNAVSPTVKFLLFDNFDNYNFRLALQSFVWSSGRIPTTKQKQEIATRRALLEDHVEVFNNQADEFLVVGADDFDADFLSD